MNVLDRMIKSIEPLDGSIKERIQSRLDMLTKPQGSLGRLEELAQQVCAIVRKDKVIFAHKVIFTLAGDHGVAEEGVSAFPQEVTAQMVQNFIEGGAGINVLARHVGARVVVADLGVKADIHDEKKILRSKNIAKGTNNFLYSRAMTRENAVRSIEAGIALFEEERERGVDIAGIGEMGIANTTSASAIVSIITGKPVDEVTGRGTGIKDEVWEHKKKVVQEALRKHDPKTGDVVDILSKVGGYEIGGMAGVILAAASYKVPVVIDGFISTAAALLAALLQPLVKDYCIAAHCSVEQGHQVALDFLGLRPLLDLNMRLGEGTGAALAMNIVEAGTKILNEMATFKEAGVSQKNHENR